jgi:hypothetical protein
VVVLGWNGPLCFNSDAPAANPLDLDRHRSPVAFFFPSPAQAHQDYLLAVSKKKILPPFSKYKMF